MSEELPFCLFCQRKTIFQGDPVEVKTLVGRRKRLRGRCIVCDHEVSCFLPSDEGPTIHNVKVGETLVRELRRASALLEISQRATVENILSEHLAAFVRGELIKLERSGLISRSELGRRQRELAKPVNDWTAAEYRQGANAGQLQLWLSDVLQKLFGERK